MQRYCCHCLSAIRETDRVCPVCGYAEDAKVPTHHLPAGTMLRDRYFIGTALGEGGFGITYAGFDTMLNRKVAIKEYYPNGFVSRTNTVSNSVVSSTDQSSKEFFEKGRRRFLDEARVLAEFSGTGGVVNVLDCFEANNTVYIVMEFLEGCTLKHYLASSGKLSVKDTFDLLMPVMNALKKIHRKGLIHRDISPDNIMLTHDEEGSSVRLIDFGAARNVTSADNKSLTVILKRGFAPMEQYTSTEKQGAWTDVYALCATIYVCITGVTPPAAPDRLYNDTLKAPSALGVAIDPHTESVIMKGLSIVAAARYQSVDELLDDLSFRGSARAGAPAAREPAAAAEPVAHTVPLFGKQAPQPQPQSPDARKPAAGKTQPLRYPAASGDTEPLGNPIPAYGKPAPQPAARGQAAAAAQPSVNRAAKGNRPAQEKKPGRIRGILLTAVAVALCVAAVNGISQSFKDDVATTAGLFDNFNFKDTVDLKRMVKVGELTLFLPESYQQTTEHSAALFDCYVSEKYNSSVMLLRDDSMPKDTASFTEAEYAAYFTEEYNAGSVKTTKNGISYVEFEHAENGTDYSYAVGFYYVGDNVYWQVECRCPAADYSSLRQEFLTYLDTVSYVKRID